MTVKTLTINNIPVAKYSIEPDKSGDRLFLKDLHAKEFEIVDGIPEDIIVNLISGVENRTFTLLGFLNI